MYTTNAVSKVLAKSLYAVEPIPVACQHCSTLFDSLFDPYFVRNKWVHSYFIIQEENAFCNLLAICFFPVQITSCKWLRYLSIANKFCSRILINKKKL